MKVSMSEEGVLLVEPETTLEAYALRTWGSEAIVHMNDMDRMEAAWVRGSHFILSTVVAKEA